jgi:hypothetical protein
MPSMWQKRQDSNPSHSVLETEHLVINIDVQAPKWFMLNHQSSPLFAQVAVSVAVKLFYRQYPQSRYLSLRRTRLNHAPVRALA